MNGSNQILVRRWCRLGVLFNVPPSRQTPDLERLLLDTATAIPGSPRLFIMAATWLSHYGRLVARHRLRRMVGEAEDPAAVAVLGLLLDTVDTMCHTDVFAAAKSACGPASTQMPLFTADRASNGLAEFARSRASKVSKRWNLWTEDIELKTDALRPLDWIMEKNPSMQVRAILSGGLRASILACLQYDATSGASEAQLARLCGATRKAVHEAADHLELCGMIDRTRPGRDYKVALKRALCAAQPHSGSRSLAS